MSLILNNLETKISIFKGKNIRKTIYQNEWWFSVVDIVQALTDQQDDYKARKYWNKLAQRLREEGSEVVTNCHRLKLLASDKKLYETDCANTEDSKGMPKLKSDAKFGGNVAGVARKKLEKRLGKSIISKKNYLKNLQGRKNIKITS